MKRPILAVLCCASLLANAGEAAADPVFDQDMASRYLQAAQSGDDEAQFYLGALYSAGVGVPRSDEEAFRWFSRAADQGHAHAMLILAGLYAVGRGVQKNNIKAYKWAYIVNGASRVDEFRNGSRQLMGVLEARMSPEDSTMPSRKPDAGARSSRGRPAQSAAPPAVSAAPARDRRRHAAAPAPAAPARSRRPRPPADPEPAAASARRTTSTTSSGRCPGLRKKFGF